MTLSSLRSGSFAALAPLRSGGFAALASILLTSPTLRAETHYFDFVIDSLQSVPAVVGSNGTGVGSVLYDDVTKLFTLSGTYQNLADTLSFSVLHGPAPSGSIAPGITGIADDGGLAGDLSLTLTLDAAQEAELLAGLWYVDLHTVFVGDGTELRGQIVRSVQAFCMGDGGDTPGCTPCPCGNDAPAGALGGCLNESGRSARLTGRGLASLANDELRFELLGANPNTFALLASGDNALPAMGACPVGSGVTSPVLNGLRCGGGNLIRHGARPTDANGDAGITNNGWGGQSGPATGLLAQGAFAAGQTRHFQVFYREEAESLCMTGQNTTNGGTITVLP